MKYFVIITFFATELKKCKIKKKEKKKGNVETTGVRKVTQKFTQSQNKSFIGIRVGQ